MGRTRRDLFETGAQGLLSSVALGSAIPGLVDQGSVDVRLPGVVSLTDVGAAGNGKDDDTAAIGHALRQVAAAPQGGVVFAPPGVYKTAGGHVLSPRVQLVGSGVGSTVFRHVGGGSCFTLTGPGISEQRVGIADCSIVGSGVPSAAGVEFRDISFGAWARLVRVRDYQAGIGFLVNNFASGQFSEGVTLLGCSSSNNHGGVVFRRTNGTNSFKAFYAQQFGCNIPADGTGFDFGVGGGAEIVVYNSYFHGHLWFDRKARNIGWDIGAKAILRDGQAWMSGEGSTPTSLAIRNRKGGKVTLFGQWWFNDIRHDIDRKRTKIGPLTGVASRL